jgi:hypothetical protein
MPKLTQRLIESLRPDENRDRIVFDETVPGFGVRVFRSGRKSYLIQYRSQKRTRRFTLGNCNVLTPLAGSGLTSAHSIVPCECSNAARPRQGSPGDRGKPPDLYRMHTGSGLRAWFRVYL